KGANKLDFHSEKLGNYFYGRSSTAVVQNVLPVLWKYRPQIVISEGAASYLTLWILLFLRFFFRYKLIIWTHGVKYNEFDSPFKGMYGRVRMFLLNHADAVLLYSEGRKRILSNYINNPRKLFVAWNTMDTPALHQIHTELSLIG